MNTVLVFCSYAAMSNLVLEQLRMGVQDNLSYLVCAANFGFLSEMGGRSHTTGIPALSSYLPCFYPSTSGEMRSIVESSCDRLLSGIGRRALVLSSRCRPSRLVRSPDTLQEVNSLVASAWSRNPDNYDDGAYILASGGGESGSPDITLVASGPILYVAREVQKELENLGLSMRVINVFRFGLTIDQGLHTRLARLLPRTGRIITCWDGDRYYLLQHVAAAMVGTACKSLGISESADANGSVADALKAIDCSADGVIRCCSVESMGG